MQVVLLKVFLRLIRYIVIWASEILQMDLDISPELVVFSEHCNDGNFKVTC